jgi:hypothetical protein
VNAQRSTARCEPRCSGLLNSSASARRNLLRISCKPIALKAWRSCGRTRHACERWRTSRARKIVRRARRISRKLSVPVLLANLRLLNHIPISLCLRRQEIWEISFDKVPFLRPRYSHYFRFSLRLCAVTKSTNARTRADKCRFCG